ncbi:MAG: hypothetical protein LBQ49_01310 [Rickettsiales bacterium]|jgi:hypothetical protein|nr:hypothetical protein [Rickettsiales bacterium]
MDKRFRILLVWSAAYVLFSTALFYFLFGFGIWSPAAWAKLPGMVIRGISGLTFSAALLSFIPIYLASAKYIWKNGRIPFFTAEKKAEESDALPEIDPNAARPHNFPENLPDELKEPFIRYYSGTLARNAMEFIQHRDPAEQEISADADIAGTADALENAAVSGKPVASTAAFADKVARGTADAPGAKDTAGAFMPLPEDFDAVEDSSFVSAPVFHDMDFGESKGPLEIKEIGGKVVATYVFDDPDFWVADDSDDWFATGKQITSPIKALLDVDADARVLILKSKNIMDLEKLIPVWSKKGIAISLDD